MIYIVLFFLSFSLLLSLMLAGADFGAGIVELFSSKENQEITKKTVYRVMGPVWEANHIWIIILIVILWVGFPSYYNVMVIYLHIPLTLMLLGITMRGVAFVFRHYDAYKDRSQNLYDAMFKFSSLVTPIFLGMTFGAMISGQMIVTEDLANYSFKELYITPWFNGFALMVGLFFAALCAFLSAVLLIGEADLGKEKVYIRKSAIATIVVVLIGLVTITYGYFNQQVFVSDFLSNIYALGMLAISGILLIPLWKNISKGHKVFSRIFAGLQVLLILVAALSTHFPNLIITSTGTLDLMQSVAPEKTISTLGITLIIGGLVILPGLFHLLKSFKMIKILEK